MRGFRLKRQKIQLSENDIEKQCLDLLRWRGYYVIRIHSGLFKTCDDKFITMAEKGTPDYAVIHSHFPGFLLEVKRPGAKASDDQVKQHLRLRLGYRLHIITISDVKVLSTWLDQHERQTA